MQTKILPSTPHLGVENGTGAAAQEVGQFPSLEVFQNHRAVALRDVGRGTVGWLELDIEDLGVFSNLNSSVLQMKFWQCSGCCGLRT